MQVSAMGTAWECSTSINGKGDCRQLYADHHKAGKSMTAASHAQAKIAEPLRAGTAAFEPRARLLKLIGAELISDEVVAMAELIKNAHDADASRVVVSFSDAASGC